MRKVVRDREIKTICKITVTRPLAIGSEIGDRTLNLDNQEIASPAEPEDVGAAPVEKRKFGEAGITELVERAADAAREERGCRRGVNTGWGGHNGPHIICRINRLGENDGVSEWQ